MVFTDGYTQRMSAAILGEGDVALFISSTGRPRELQESLELAKYYKATCIAITDKDSPTRARCRHLFACGLAAVGRRRNSTQPDALRADVRDRPAGICRRRYRRRAGPPGTAQDARQCRLAARHRCPSNPSATDSRASFPDRAGPAALSAIECNNTNMNDAFLIDGCIESVFMPRSHFAKDSMLGNVAAIRNKPGSALNGVNIRCNEPDVICLLISSLH